MDNLPKILEHIRVKLKDLSPELKYHCFEHTLDVYEQSKIIAEAEGVTDPEQLYLLQIAALYHDSGFLYIYQGHEEVGCELADIELPSFGINDQQLSIIKEIIMATKIPQTPKNKLEEIICDADLDYLGRDDYDIINQKLHHEFLKEGYVKNDKEWKELQIKFFDSHHYFTNWSKKNRAPVKAEHLEKIKADI
jgi:uncharacterized protein